VPLLTLFADGGLSYTGPALDALVPALNVCAAGLGTLMA